MLPEDGSTPSSALPVPADSLSPTAGGPSAGRYHLFADCFGDPAPTANLDKPLLKSSPNAAEQSSLISQDDVYFEQFLGVFYEEAFLETRQTTIQVPDRGRRGGESTKTTAKAGSTLAFRFHKCLCLECCVQPGTWVASPDFISTRLPFSGLQIDLINRNSLRLSGHFMSLFVSIDEARDFLPTVALTFHNKTKVLVRHFGGSGNCKRQLQREVDIINKQYSLTFRSNSVSFTSDANLLTYSIDKSGCKTKICKHNNIGQEDFVTKQFQYELNRHRAKLRSLARHANKNKGGQGRKGGRKYKSPPTHLLQKCQLKSSPTEPNLVWAVDEFLKISEQPSGSLYVQNEKSRLYLSVHRQNSLSLQLANLCIILNKSGHLFVAQQPNIRSEESTGHISGSSEMSIVHKDIELLSQMTRPKGSQQQQEFPRDLSSHSSGQAASSGFSLNRVMTNAEQFAICGVGGLLVKHHNRRAGLNQKNLICLL